MINIEKNEYYEGTVVDLTHDGLGVVSIDGFPIFTKDTLPNEEVKIKVVKLKKNYGFGKLIEILNKSNRRIEPKCEIYHQCGGCNLQHLDYQEQLNIKTKQVKETLKRIGKIETEVHETLGMNEPWNYRNKTQIPIGRDINSNEIIAGFYKERTHEIIDMKKCDIQDRLADNIINTFKELINKHNIEPYDEKSHSGFLRHVIIRKGFTTNEYMVVLVVNSNTLPKQDLIIKELTYQYPQIKSIALNINKKKTNVIYGDLTQIIFGHPYIYDVIGNVKFGISPRSFYQVNPMQTKVLYDKVLEYADLKGNEVLIDAYCGIGTIGLFAASRVDKVYGVEIVEDAIEDAKYNSRLNSYSNTHFEAGKAEEVIPRWKEEGIKADVIIVDPPRKGCDKVLLDTIIDMEIPRVVYVSCNPGTLARDLRILEDGGYEVKEVQPVDMFPHTTHVETVVKLQRRNP